MKKTARHTYSVCPVCLERIPATQVERDGAIYLEKSCPRHGDFSALLWRGLVDIDSWRGEEPTIATGENESCPHACGLCPEHRQETCCTVLEVTKRCNIRCTFCFADGGEGEDIPLETIHARLNALAKPGKTLVQLSGGEPTVRDDLPEIVRAAFEARCAHVQLNTNGIRLAEDPAYVARLAEAGLSFAFLQFDGTDDEIHRSLRGRDLAEIKSRAIDNCAANNIGVTLVPTLVPGVNTHQVGEIIRYAVARSPAVRGVHFQPVSYFGRIPSQPKDEDRFTLDELLTAIVEQTDGLVGMDTLLPARFTHPLCGFHADFVVTRKQGLYPLHRRGCSCGSPVTADQNRSFITSKWKRPEQDESATETGCCEADLKTLDGFLKFARTFSFTLTSMPFQDAWNLDLERLRRCSLHVFDDGKFVPFCSYYLTAQG
ncbi:MAG: radical SAM protein [Synergistaceae bacterium]|nr:radical SAM protein [Synergistaceae bacterium]